MQKHGEYILKYRRADKKKSTNRVFFMVFLMFLKK